MPEDWTCDQLKACAHAKGDYHEGLAMLHLNAVGWIEKVLPGAAFWTRWFSPWRPPLHV